ncbi:MAG: hypothetical protein JXA50_02330 [Deltaproteobacteria bacterium]|nr:hypothetical protein [Deltaproteobacteria bacterium]
MSRFARYVVVLLLIVSIGGFFLSCASRHRRCPPGQHWVSGHHRPNGVWVPGHCAPN